MATIDLNCDLGEGGGHDAELLELVTSANIACGGHAGDEATMRTTAMRAAARGVAIGAHPGFADREHFGRRELPVRPGQVEHLVRQQVQRLRDITPLRHVKPHGALYNLAARNAGIAAEVAAGVAAVDTNLILVGLAGSALVTAGREAGLAVVGEGFADRTYQDNGSLTPRSDPAAMISVVDDSMAQVMAMARERRVRSQRGAWVPVDVQTICLHGDAPHAVEFARHLRAALAAAGIRVEAFGR